MHTLRILKKGVLYWVLGTILRAGEEYRYFFSRRQRIRKIDTALAKFRNLKVASPGKEKAVRLEIVKEFAKAMHLWLAENRNVIESLRNGSEERVGDAKEELERVGVPSSLAERLAKRNENFVVLSLADFKERWEKEFFEETLKRLDWEARKHGLDPEEIARALNEGRKRAEFITQTQGRR